MSLLENLLKIDVIILLLITLALFIVKILLSYYISQSEFYKNLKNSQVLRPEIAVLTTILTYALAIIGITYIYSDPLNEEKLTSLFVSSLFILLLFASLYWQIFFGIFQNIQLSVVGYIIFILVLCYYIAEISKISLFAALLTIPLLIREIVYFFFIEQLFVDNPEKVI